MRYFFYFFIIIILIGCHELPESKLVPYYVLNDSSNDSSFNYSDKNLNVVINIRGYGFAFTMDEQGVIFSSVVININNHGEDNLHVSFANLELQSNYLQYILVDTLKGFELSPNGSEESKFLFKSSNNTNIIEVPMDDILNLKLKLFIEGNKLDLPEVIFSPRKKN